MFDTDPTLTPSAPSAGQSQHDVSHGRDALFYSCTDKRGVIEEFNSVFAHFSQHDATDLLGAPHKIIRHPDMPKGLFYLKWHLLKQNKIVGAYVKNRAKDGSHYWVYALVMPLPQGYLSVRQIPDTEKVKAIEQIYQRLIVEETDEGLSPQRSADRFLDLLKDAGFDTYESFMHEALESEYQLRNQDAGVGANAKFNNLSRVNEGILKIHELIQKVDDTFKEAHQIPFNMRLQAGRLEGTSGPISVISTNHREMTQRLEESVQEFRGAKGLRGDVVKEAIFYNCSSHLLTELAEKLTKEGYQHDVDSGQSGSEFIRQNAVILDVKASELMQEIVQRISTFPTVCRDIRRLMSGLELTRIMCKIERSKQSTGTDGLDEIIHRLGEAQHKLSDVLTEIEDVSNETAATAVSLL